MSEETIKAECKKTLEEAKDQGLIEIDKCIIIQKEDMFAGWSVGMQCAGPWGKTVQEAVDAMEEFMPVPFEWELSE